MTKPYGKKNVEFGYVIVHGSPGYICGTMHRTKTGAINWYNALWEKPDQFRRDRKKCGTRVAKAELRVVEEWNHKSEGDSK